MGRVADIIRMTWEVTKRAPKDVYPQHVEQLIGYAEQLHRLDETACNRELRDWEEKKRDVLWVKIKHVANEFGATPYHQGDPRGCPLYLMFPGDVAEGEDVGSVYNRGVAIY